MPWDEGAIHQRGLKGRENLRIPFGPWRYPFPRPFRPQEILPALTQGIGLRPQPWAGISRPVGPVCQALSGARHAGDRRWARRAQGVPPREGCCLDRLPDSIALLSLAVRLHEEDRREGFAIRTLWPGGIRARRGRIGWPYVFPAPRTSPVDAL
jgi:hypothetical protein